jgi:glycosyltransferase involved in cell wall biosynthesis
VVVELSRALRNDGVDVEVWHFGNSWLQQRLSEHAIPCVHLDWERCYRSALSLPWFWKHASRLLRDRGVHAVHSHLLGACFAWAAPSNAAGVPHIATLHDAYSLKGSAKARLMLRWACRSGTRIAGVSGEVCDLVAACAPGSRPELVINGISEPVRTADSRAAIRARYGAADTDVVFIAVGRIVSIKRHDLMIEAFANRSVPETACLWIVGDGPLRAALQARVHEARLAARISFLGESQAVPDLLTASDGMLSASDSEGLSMALIEGLAASLPIVATAVGGNDLIVRRGANGILVPAGDAVAIARALADVASDAARRREMGEASRRQFDEQFTVRKMAAHYAALYAGQCAPA